uniref:Piwi domain-containing protein n=1 Tax=Panagrolaimus davidi TaxID=227884 RepID=A0A914PI00_9BILA
MNHPSGGMGNPQNDSKNASENASKHEQSAADIGSSSDTSTFPANVSILGFCANDGDSIMEFLQMNLLEISFSLLCILSVFDKFLEEIIERFQKNRGSPPSRIILFRNGCDEGSYQSVLRFEMAYVFFEIRE